jgi:hypothetical protein
LQIFNFAMRPVFYPSSRPQAIGSLAKESRKGIPFGHWRRSRLRIGYGSFIFVKDFPISRCVPIQFFRLHNILTEVFYKIFFYCIISFNIIAFRFNATFVIMLYVHLCFSIFIFYSLLLP